MGDGDNVLKKPNTKQSWWWQGRDATYTHTSVPSTGASGSDITTVLFIHPSAVLQGVRTSHADAGRRPPSNKCRRAVGAVEFRPVLFQNAADYGACESWMALPGPRGRDDGLIHKILPLLRSSPLLFQAWAPHTTLPNAPHSCPAAPHCCSGPGPSSHKGLPVHFNPDLHYSLLFQYGFSMFLLLLCWPLETGVFPVLGCPHRLCFSVLTCSMPC